MIVNLYGLMVRDAAMRLLTMRVEVLIPRRRASAVSRD
jgi:hypothetical protein